MHYSDGTVKTFTLQQKNLYQISTFYLVILFLYNEIHNSLTCHIKCSRQITAKYKPEENDTLSHPKTLLVLETNDMPIKCPLQVSTTRPKTLRKVLTFLNSQRQLLLTFS